MNDKKDERIFNNNNHNKKKCIYIFIHDKSVSGCASIVSRMNVSS